MGTFTIQSAGLTQLVSLGHDVSVSATACSNYPLAADSYYIEQSATFATTTKIWDDEPGANPSPSGYYSDGTDWRYWDNGTESFTSSGSC